MRAGQLSKRLLLLAAVLLLACLAGITAHSADPALDLFGRCPLFDHVVKDELLPGKITAKQAFDELDSHNCPIIRGASITSASELEEAVRQAMAEPDKHAGHAPTADCRQLDKLTKAVWDGSGEPKQVMDALVKLACPSLTQCPTFNQIKGRYADGRLEPSRAIKELAQRCPFFSPPARPQDVEGRSMADQCRELSDMLYSVDETSEEPAVQRAAVRAMDVLCDTTSPLLNNCPHFQRVRAEYRAGQMTAAQAIAYMKGNCPILSKELNPSMEFHVDEYAGHKETRFDVHHASHGHPDGGCGCGCGAKEARNPAKQLFEREAAKDGGCPFAHLSGHHDMPHDHIHEKRAAQRTSGLEKLLGGLFPKGNPAVSSLLATFYISLFPNLILFATPSSIPNRALRVMVGFAVGGLLGDVFLHLLPHMFSDGHDHHGHSHSHDDDVPEATRNTVYGCAIFVGLLVFVVVDKFMRIFGDGHSHGHSHSHSHSPKSIAATSSSVADGKQKLRKRRTNKSDDEKDAASDDESHGAPAKKQVKMSAYLNLIADATHNFTDGLAMAASFYLSHAAGLSTFVAVFFHEIPHELGDFAILVQSGFSRSSALASQFFTALGAIAGTIAGILIEEAGSGNVLNVSGLLTKGAPLFVPGGAKGASILPGFVSGLLGLFPATVAGVPWSKLVIPFTAGGFIYVGTVSVLPDLLQPDEEEEQHGERQGKVSEELRLKRNVNMALVEIAAMLVGLAIMAVIALNEE